MITLPIDEMLGDLRAVIEQLEREPTFVSFDKLQKETTRIERECEDAVFKALDEPKEA